jgi:hypothetical protein
LTVARSNGSRPADARAGARSARPDSLAPI